MEYTEQIIEAYCNQTLAEDILHEFEAKLGSNEKLRKEVREMFITIASLNEIRSNNLQKRLGGLETSGQERIMKPVIYWYRWAAAFVLIAVAGYLIFKIVQKPGHQELYLAYMEPYPNIVEPNTRDGSRNVNTGLLMYEQQDYVNAFQSLQVTLTQDPSNMEIRFYYALSALLTDKDELAEKELQNVAASASRLSTQATWYLALTRIKTNKPDLARKDLDLLIQSNSSYKQKAEDVKKKL